MLKPCCASRHLAYAISTILLVFTGSLYAAQAPTVQVLNERAHHLIVNGELSEGFNLSSQARLQAIQSKDKKGLARALSNLGSVMYFLGKMEAALDYYQRSLTLAKQLNDFDALDRATNNLANVYNAIGNYKDALNIRLNFLPKAEQYGDTLHRATMYVSLAASFRLTKNEDKAIEFLKKAQRAFEQAPHAFFQLFLKKEWINIYREKGQFDTAKSYIGKGIEQSKLIDNRFQLATFYNLMAEVLFAEGQYQQAIGFAQKCLDNDQTRDTLLIRLSCLEQLALALQSAGNYQLALQNYIELNKLNEQISNDKVKQLAAIMAIEMDVKDTKLKLEQARRNQQQIELELAQQQRRFMLLVASTILLVLLLSFYYYRRYSLRKLEFERRKNEALINLDKLKDRILANTSHELRTPLNGIIGLADYLLACDDEVGSEERKSSLQLIKRSGEQLAEIVNDILDLASLRAGRMQFQYSQFQLDELVRDKCELLKPLAKAKAIDLRCDLPAAPVHISSDPKRIGQVLVNLLGNAIKFTDEGGVTVKLQADNKQCRIHIMDTGIGIPEQHVERIFEGFEQVNAGNTRPFAGSGLGLAICREILAGLGGKIKLSSQVGKGTQIEISLPLEKKAT